MRVHYSGATAPQEKVIQQIHQLGVDIFQEEESQISLNITDSASEGDQALCQKTVRNQFRFQSLHPSRNNPHYGRHYNSPYSQRRSKSTRSNNSGQSLPLQSVALSQRIKHHTNRPLGTNKQANYSNKDSSKQRQTLNYESLVSHNYKSTANQKPKTKKYGHVKSRYRQVDSLLDQRTRIKTIQCETHAQEQWHRRNTARNNAQQLWQDFLLREHQWESKRLQRARQRQHKFHEMQEQARKPVKQAQARQHVFTIDQCIQKIKRDTIKLKERLSQHENNYFVYKGHLKVKGKLEEGDLLHCAQAERICKFARVAEGCFRKAQKEEEEMGRFYEDQTSRLSKDKSKNKKRQHNQRNQQKQRNQSNEGKQRKWDTVSPVGKVVQQNRPKRSITEVQDPIVPAARVQLTSRPAPSKVLSLSGHKYISLIDPSQLSFLVIPARQ